MVNGFNLLIQSVENNDLFLNGGEYVPLRQARRYSSARVAFEEAGCHKGRVVLVYPTGRITRAYPGDFYG